MTDENQNPSPRRGASTGVVALIVLLGAGTLFVIQSCSATPPADPQSQPKPSSGAPPGTAPNTPPVAPMT